MYELYTMMDAPVVTDLTKVISKLFSVLAMVQACYDSTCARWEAFENANAPCHYWDDSQRYEEWLDSDEVSEVHNGYVTEEARLADNIDWIKENIKRLEDIKQSLEFMDSDGLLPKC